jgi:hypothetical protein
VTDASRSSSRAETSGSLSPTLDDLGASTARMQVSSGSFGLYKKIHRASNSHLLIAKKSLAALAALEAAAMGEAVCPAEKASIITHVRTMTIVPTLSI